MAKKELSERDRQAIDTLDKIIYQRVETDVENTYPAEPYTEVYDSVDDFVGKDGELIGVYKLSHFARVKTKPASVSLQTVRAK